jgi:hypothetical protein
LFFVICAGVFPQKTPEQSVKIVNSGSKFVSCHVFASLTLAVSCGLGPPTHNGLGAPTFVPTKTTNHPAIESFEFFQRSNEPVNLKLISFETGNSPFLDSFLTPTSAAGKQEKWKNLSLGCFRRFSGVFASFS